MQIRLKLALLAVFAVTAFSFAGSASAQATRTWVSGVGDDVNPCSRTAPCKTFAGAISKTAAGGEINCLDAGGFGTLTITKSITVDCSGTFGSTLNAGGINGFVINDSLALVPGTADVILRGLSINGAGTTPGLNGVRVLSGRSLLLQNVFIQNQRGSAGISLQPTRPLSFHAQDVTIVHGNSGIVVQPTGIGSVRGVLHNVRVESNSNAGLRADTTGLVAGLGVHLTVTDSVFSKNASGVSAIGPAGSVTSLLMLKGLVVSVNTGHGIAANGPSAEIVVGSSTIFSNAPGVDTPSSGKVFTYSTNQLNFNNPDGAFTSAAARQ